MSILTPIFGFIKSQTGDNIGKTIGEDLPANWDKVEQLINDLATYKGTLLRLNVNQSIPNNVDTAVSWDTVLYDTNNFYSAGSPTRLTVPTGVKKVRVSANIYWASNAVGNRTVRILKNNNIGSSDGTPEVINANTGSYMAQNVSSGILAVNAGNYFEVIVNQNSGGALNISRDAGRTRLWFGLEVVEYES